MAKKAETGLQRRIRAALERELGGWWFKVWGGPFQVAGIPDLVGCVCGMFFAIEVKTPTGEPSDIQIETIKRINAEGGGYAFIAVTPEEAVREVRQCLEKAGRLPAARRAVRIERANGGSILRAGDREDLDSRRRPRKLTR